MTRCPRCGQPVHPRNPYPTVDVIVFHPRQGVVLVDRANPPWGWALPGGFVDYGETVEAAARRELREETGIHAEELVLVGVYSDPGRDPRFHTLSVVFATRAQDGTIPRGSDDARTARFFALDDLPPLAFDHGRILDDFVRNLRNGVYGSLSAP